MSVPVDPIATALVPSDVPDDGLTVSRRRFYAVAANALGGLIALVVGIPGIAYLLSPILGKRESEVGEFRELPVTLGELPVGTPRQFPLIEARDDAWVKYPPEPIGAVWLIRQPEGSTEPVLAFTAECPHLGCSINLAADGENFFCPCHNSAFKLDGERLNDTPPRPMDRLEVETPSGPDGRVRVKFQRFRTQSKEKTPLV
jgi:menaquinol-cytochrome c reductase iron-sulfur subunit